MPEFLLTKEEWEKIYNTLPDKAMCADCGEAISQATLRKVATWIRHNSTEPHAYRPFRFTCWGTEEWAALMQEAGLEK